MTQVFLDLLNMSISASWMILAVLVLRFAMKKAPRWAVCGLWALVAIRLVFPFSIESVFSLIPSTQTLPMDILTENRFQISSGVPVIDHQINDVVLDDYYEGITVPTDNGFNVMSTLTVVWLLGMAAIILYALISYLQLRHKVSASINLRDTLYLCDYIESPFILGIIRPKIYLPSTLEEVQWPHVIAHEKAHLKRRDHWWKPLGYGLLCLHWFNPLMWVAYILLCRDIELACDEKVIKELGETQKKAYSEALLSCSVPRYMIAACPLAFGEVGVKERVKSVLNYKKPAFWVILISLVLCIAVAVCFLTDPLSGSDPGTGEEFRATVLEINDTQILVEPEADSAAAASCDRIWVTLPQDAPHIVVGDTVRVVYDGLIASSYPAQINSATLVTVVDPVSDVANALRERLGTDHFGGAHLQDGILIVSVVRGLDDLPATGTEVINGITVVYRQVDMSLAALVEAVARMEPQMGQYGIVSVRVDVPGNSVIVSVYQEEPNTRQFVEQHIDIANYTVEYLESAALTPGQEDVTNVVTLSPRQQELAAEYPCYFGLSTAKGLEVYTRTDWFQVRYVLMQGTSRVKGLDEIEALPALTAEDMKDILAAYDIPASSVAIFNDSDLTEKEIRDLLGITVSPTENTWNIQFYATNVSPNGLTLICQRGGGAQDAMLLTGRYYWLEELTPDGWKEIEAEERLFFTDAQGIAPNETVSWPLDWASTYGTLGPGQYRVGKILESPDGETMTFYTQFRTSGSTIESAEDWGITLSVTDVTPTGATLVCSRSAVSQLDLFSGVSYGLQIQTGNGWVSLQEGLQTTTTAAYFIPIGVKVTQELDWSNLHGTLLPGTYRVVKTITTNNYPDDNYYQTYYAEFSIPYDSGIDISLSLSDVSPTGATMVFGPTGDLELGYGSRYWIETLVDDVWQEVPQADTDIDLIWTDEIRLLSQDSPTEVTVDWSMRYGTLEPGIYRLGKTILEPEVVPGTQQTCYAEFEITAETVPVPNGWNIAMEVTDVTSTGAVIIYTVMEPGTGDMWTNYDYWLEVLTDSGWVRAPGPDPMEIGWEDATLFSCTDSADTNADTDNQAQIHVSWHRVADVPLPSGTYRFCKPFYFSIDGIATTQTLYAEFEVTDSGAVISTDPPGTYYRLRTLECLYMNPLSSQSALDDNGKNYVFDNGMFSVVIRSTDEILIQCPTDETQWQEFPFSQERWEEILSDGYDDLSDIRDRLWGAQYRLLSDNYCLFLKDGTLYVAYGFFDSTIPWEYFWEIYELTID